MEGLPRALVRFHGMSKVVAAAVVASTAAAVTAARYLGVSWDALAAVATIFTGVATFGAVYVALLPIWEGEERHTAQARLLRGRLLNHLGMLLEGFERIIANADEVNVYAEVFDSIMDDIEMVEALYPQLDLLGPKSFDAVVQLVPNLVRIRRMGTRALDKDSDVKHVAVLTSHAIDALEGAGAVLHRQPLQPWNEIEGKSAPGSESPRGRSRMFFQRS